MLTAGAQSPDSERGRQVFRQQAGAKIPMVQWYMCCCWVGWVEVINDVHDEGCCSGAGRDSSLAGKAVQQPHPVHADTPTVSKSVTIISNNTKFQLTNTVEAICSSNDPTFTNTHQTIQVDILIFALKPPPNAECWACPPSLLHHRCTQVCDRGFSPSQHATCTGPVSFLDTHTASRCQNFSQ